jgi:hypothetical protein
MSSEFEDVLHVKNIYSQMPFLALLVFLAVPPSFFALLPLISMIKQNYFRRLFSHIPFGY